MPGKKKTGDRQKHIMRPPHNNIAVTKTKKNQVKDWYAHVLDKAFLRRTSTIKLALLLSKLTFLLKAFGLNWPENYTILVSLQFRV